MPAPFMSSEWITERYDHVFEKLLEHLASGIFDGVLRDGLLPLESILRRGDLSNFTDQQKEMLIVSASTQDQQQKLAEVVAQDMENAL